MTDDGKKLDRRVVRTRRLLRDALMFLILEKGYDAVTVQDITDQANLGRATFYLHYQDKEDLLSRSLEEIYDDLVLRLQHLSREQLLLGEEAPSLIAFRHAAENQDLYLVLLRGQGAHLISRRIQQYIADVVVQNFLHLLADRPQPVSLDLIANHVAGSLIAMITWWLENEMPHSPEYMSRIFSKLIMPGVLAISTSDMDTPG